jgi:hypothetical protein
MIVLLNDALTWTIALPMFFRTFFFAISFFPSFARAIP